MTTTSLCVKNGKKIDVLLSFLRIFFDEFRWVVSFTESISWVCFVLKWCCVSDIEYVSIGCKWIWSLWLMRVCFLIKTFSEMASVRDVVWGDIICGNNLIQMGLRYFNRIKGKFELSESCSKICYQLVSQAWNSISHYHHLAKLSQKYKRVLETRAIQGASRIFYKFKHTQEG